MMRRWISMLTACVLSVCCLSLPVRAAEEWQPFTVLVQTDAQEPFVGNFLRGNGEILVDVNTVAAMTDDIQLGLSLNGRELALYREEVSITYPMNELRENAYGIYVPFAKTLEALALNGEADPDKKLLHISPSEEDTAFTGLLAENWLKKAEETNDPSFYWPETAAWAMIPTMPVTVRASWNDGVSDTPMSIDVLLEGTFLDGSMVIAAETEGVYLNSANYTSVAFLQKTQGLTELEITELAGDYTICIEWGECEGLPGLTYADIGLCIEVSTPVETIITLAADPETVEETVELTDPAEFYSRGGTGVWYYGFHLDYGQIQTLAGEPMFPEQMEETVTYTESGKVESIKKYDEKGRMVLSEWYDDGECTAYTYWEYDGREDLIRIRYQNLLEPEEVVIEFTYDYDENEQLTNVKMYNERGTLLAEGESAYAAANQLGVGYLVEESLNPR